MVAQRFTVRFLTLISKLDRLDLTLKYRLNDGATELTVINMYNDNIMITVISMANGKQEESQTLFDDIVDMIIRLNYLLSDTSHVKLYRSEPDQDCWTPVRGSCVYF